MSEAKKRKNDEKGSAGVKKAKEDKLRIGFQGLAGSYSEQAASAYFKIETIEPVGFRTIGDVFQEVAQERCDYGLVPIENSETGSFRRVYDLLTTSGLYIQGECSVQDDHCFCVLPGVKKQDVKKMYSHTEVLEQCRGFILKLEATNGAPVERFGVWNTAAACEIVAKEGWRDSGVIASRRAAEIYKLEVLDTSLTSDVAVATRYIILGKSPGVIPPDAKHIKTSIVIGLRNETGALFKCVSCFALRNISILKLETRPDTKGKAMFEESHHWSYIFYIDFEPSRNELVNKALMENLREYCSLVQELGTYVQNLPRRRVEYPFSALM